MLQDVLDLIKPGTFSFFKNKMHGTCSLPDSATLRLTACVIMLQMGHNSEVLMLTIKLKDAM